MGEIKRLPDSEEVVMSIIWGSDDAPDLAAVREKAAGRYGKDWKPQTISTLLCRLVRKGFLSSYRKGRYTYYVPLIRREDYCESMVQRMSDLFFDGMVQELGNFAVDLRTKGSPN